jgi:predicted PurR-regulated permease PerM
MTRSAPPAWRDLWPWPRHREAEPDLAEAFPPSPIQRLTAAGEEQSTDPLGQRAADSRQQVRTPGEPARMPVPPLLVDLADWAWRVVLLIVTAYLLLRVAGQLYLVTLPVAAALLLTALLSPVAVALRQRRMPRGLATAVTVVGLLAVVSALLTWVVRRAVDEAPTLAAELRKAVRELPLNNEVVLRLRDQALAQLQPGDNYLTTGVLSGVQTGIEVLTGLVLTLLLTIILLADGDRMWHWLVARLPVNARPRAVRAALPAWQRLSGWIRGTVVIAAFHSVVVAVTLLVLQVPLVAPLTVVVFLGSFIPLAGAVLAGALAALVTFATQGPTATIVILVVLLVDNQIEAHALQPFLVGRYVRLHPFVVAVVITAGALLGGLAGALLAVPLTAAVYAALTNLPDPGPTRRPRPRRRRTESTRSAT